MSSVTVYNVFHNDDLEGSQDKFLGGFTSEDQVFTVLVDYIMENDTDDDIGSGWVVPIQSRSSTNEILQRSERVR